MWTSSLLIVCFLLGSLGALVDNTTKYTGVTAPVAILNIPDGLSAALPIDQMMGDSPLAPVNEGSVFPKPINTTLPGDAGVANATTPAPSSAPCQAAGVTALLASLGLLASFK